MNFARGVGKKVACPKAERLGGKRPKEAGRGGEDRCPFDFQHPPPKILKCWNKTDTQLINLIVLLPPLLFLLGSRQHGRHSSRGALEPLSSQFPKPEVAYILPRQLRASHIYYIFLRSYRILLKEIILPLCDVSVTTTSSWHHWLRRDHPSCSHPNARLPFRLLQDHILM